MKARREHRVPLSPEVIELLHSRYCEESNPYLFIGRDRGTHLAANTVTEALRRTGFRQTIHGFRASLKTWSEEKTAFPSLIIELSLAHKVGSAVENAYRRGDVIVKRRKLMEAWAKFCCTPPAADAGTVLPMRGRA